MIRARDHVAIGTKVINRHSTSDRDARNDRGARPLAGFGLVSRARSWLSASPLRGQLHRGALAMLFSRFTEDLTGVLTNR